MAEVSSWLHTLLNQWDAIRPSRYLHPRMQEPTWPKCHRTTVGVHWEPLGTIGNHWKTNTQTSFGRVPAGTRAGCFPSVSAKCKSAENPAGGTSVWTCAPKETWGHKNSILRKCDGQNDPSASGHERFSGDGCRCGATGFW